MGLRVRRARAEQVVPYRGGVMKKKTLTLAGWSATLAATTLITLLMLPTANAASGDGSLVGHLTSADKANIGGAEITARNPQTGFSRTVKADADGNYRFPFLPVGRYTIEASKDCTALGTLNDVTVNLGVATTADFELGGSKLDVVQVLGTRIVTAIDVSSTEIATNVTREELERLPVERDLLSVANLAPGISKGEFDGVSFGGSSVAENTIYINGLNVTDFYKRIG